MCIVAVRDPALVHTPAFLDLALIASPRPSPPIPCVSSPPITLPSFPSLQVLPAHGPGVKAPSIHNGVAVLQGVRALCLRANNSELVSGGSDGTVYCWDLAGGNMSGRIVKKIEVGGGGTHEVGKGARLAGCWE